MSDEERSRTATLRVKETPRPSMASQIQLEEPTISDAEVTIVLTQAFCPQGHNLVQEDHPRFDGQPGIRLRIGFAGTSVDVTLSPIHGDARKRTAGSPLPANGEKLSVCCPQCGTELTVFGDCTAGDGGHLRQLYLTPRLDDGHVALICDVWGCPHSRVVDEWSVLSEVVLAETAEGPEEA